MAVALLETDSNFNLETVSMWIIVFASSKNNATAAAFSPELLRGAVVNRFEVLTSQL